MLDTQSSVNRRGSHAFRVAGHYRAQRSGTMTRVTHSTSRQHASYSLSSAYNQSVRLPGRDLSAPAPPWRPLLRLTGAGVVIAILILVIGRLGESLVLGATDAAARARVEAGVRADFDQMSRALRVMALGMADAESVVLAASGDTTAARRLFAAADAAVAQSQDDDVALTAYGADSRALAWVGRPSELPPERLSGDESWFLTPGALGLRLVYVTPVLDPQGTRVGAVAAERALGAGARRTSAAGGDLFRYDGPIAPVSIALRFEGPRTAGDAPAFDVASPSGTPLLNATVDATDLALARRDWRIASTSLAFLTLSGLAAFLSFPLLDWRRRTARVGPHVAALAGVACAIGASRWLLTRASPTGWLEHPLFTGADYASTQLDPLLATPLDFLMTAVAAAWLAWSLFTSVESWRLGRRRQRPGTLAFAAIAHLAAGMGLALVLVAHQRLLQDTVAGTTLDLLSFSLHPWSLSRLALHVGLLLWHASTLGCGVLALRAASTLWPIHRGDATRRALTLCLWTLPLLTWLMLTSLPGSFGWPTLFAAAVAIAVAMRVPRLAARYRHGSQAFRLTLTMVGFVVPAVTFYPAMYQTGRQAKTQLVESRYAPQAVNQRQTVQRLLQDSLGRIDRFPGLAELASTPTGPPDLEALTDRAYQVWRVTGLAQYPVTSSVELYDPDGALVSRFAFNLPDDLSSAPRFEEPSCTWDVYEEVSPFFAEERRILHAGRALCDDTGTVIGAVVAHAMLDYANLPFILSQNPYVELLRPADPTGGEGRTGRDIEFAAYGWSRRPLYSSGVTAWPLEDTVSLQVEASRTPVWARLQRGDTLYDVYLLNDRGGIYALGFPVASALDHLVNLAEITVLAWGTHLFWIVLSACLGPLGPRTTRGRGLLREVRASFYRKLLLAFTLATVIPVAALAVATRTYVADQMRSNVEQDAVRTAAAARRVVEDLVAPRATLQGTAVDDNLMVWVSRLIDQDVNIFAGPRLVATSERNLFASGLLPTRTPAGVHRAVSLRNDASAVVRERIGTLSYLVAATPISLGTVDAVLTVPLTPRELQIEMQIDTLDRRVLLGALLFVFCGALMGYWLTERIADPVNRLTRATRRIARGEFDVRVAAASADELGRLVEDFNRMAGELQRQRGELERTHRLEAWAEMARQVAHEIKNPLTPIQLNAEHLRRVHTDRGQPLSPVLEECVGTILDQVTLLRRIASEFSNFASSPTARPSFVPIQDLLRDTLTPYRAGLADRLRFEEDIPADLPAVFVDRTLIARSLTNLVENAVHAMPSGGTLGVSARADAGTVRIRVSDTGLGMDTEALARAFEPYFSTKSTGTGLGLPIAKRNIELNGGTIAVASTRDHGTTVELTLPTAAPPV